MQSKRVDVVSIRMVKEASFLYPNRKISSPEDAKNLFQRFLADMDKEYFVVACLNTKSEVNSVEIVSVGSLNASIVHPREVFKSAVLSNAASIIICHNHPSEHVTPSKEDQSITDRLVDAGIILGIPVIDHIILGGDQIYSFKERGNLK